MNPSRKRANKTKRPGQRQGGGQNRQTKLDSALQLRPEYSGQPVCSHIIFNSNGANSTTVTTGVIAVTTALTSANLIPALSTRFAGYDQFRIVKVEARLRMFSSTNPGLVIMYFDDTNAAPTGNAASFASSVKMNASDISGCRSLTYVPHDPAQQFWSTVAGGSATIGYFKLYTDNANFGSSIVATPYCIVEFYSTVQFRGFL